MRVISASSARALGSARLRLPSTAPSRSKIGAPMPVRPWIDLAMRDADASARAARPACGGTHRSSSPSPAAVISAASWANRDFSVRVGRCARMIFAVAPR